MSRIDIQSIESASEEASERLAAVKRASGFVPNLLGVLANAPTALETYQTVSAINNRNSLTAAEREVIQITAAVRNGCGFCAAGHSKIASKKLAMAEPVVEALRKAQSLPDAKLDALATFTAQIIEHKGQVADADLKAFLAAGYTQENALDTVLGVSLSTLCNYANNLAQTPINDELKQFALS